MNEVQKEQSCCDEGMEAPEDLIRAHILVNAPNLPDITPAVVCWRARRKEIAGRCQGKGCALKAAGMLDTYPPEDKML